MALPSIETEATCLGCGEHLFTTKAAIAYRVRAVRQLKTGKDRERAPDTIRCRCINKACSKPHQFVFIPAGKVPGVKLPK